MKAKLDIRNWHVSRYWFQVGHDTASFDYEVSFCHRGQWVIYPCEHWWQIPSAIYHVWRNIE